MYVGLRMLKDFAVITPKTLVTEASRIMLENRLWMLLVKDGDKLAGYVKKEDVRAAMPSQATTLSKHELNYLLSKLTVEKIMLKDVPSVPPETEIEEAAEVMSRENLAGLAVVDRKNNLLGFINRGVMLDVLVEEMGLRHGGSRIVFEVEDRPGVIAEVTGIISGMGVSIIATGTFFSNGKRMVVFRVRTDDPTPIAKVLHEKGYVLVGPDAFASKWQ